MTTPICDLHCDLLLYLSGNSSRTPFDRIARCSAPQFQEGGVGLQVLAVFTETGPESVKQGLRQIRIFQDLPKKYPDVFSCAKIAKDFQFQKGITQLLYAFESASGFCGEEEPLDEGLKRFDEIIDSVGNPLYISLTWNTENRFGGGNFTNVGIKEDGKELLHFLSGRKIAVDLSHTSDPLARDIFHEVDAKKLKIPIIASHSNYRSITDVPRNLPDEFVHEIILRNGLIGFNFVRPFISNEELPLFSQHLKHALELGAENQICFGADFFYEEDITASYNIPYFFDDYGDASCYPHVIRMWKEHLGISQNQIEKISHKNVIQFLENIHSICL